MITFVMVLALRTIAVDGSYAEMEVVLRQFYRTDILWGGGATGAIAQELGIVGDLEQTAPIDQLATMGIEQCQRADPKARETILRLAAHLHGMMGAEDPNQATQGGAPMRQ